MIASVPLDISISLLKVLLVIVSLLIVLVILMQRPKQDGLGAAFGGGMTDQMFGAQTTNVLQKGTAYLAVFFFVICLGLAVLTSFARESGIIKTKSADKKETSLVAEKQVAEEEAVKEEASLEEKLQKLEKQMEEDPAVSTTESVPPTTVPVEPAKEEEKKPAPTPAPPAP